MNVNIFLVIVFFVIVFVVFLFANVVGVVEGEFISDFISVMFDFIFFIISFF